MNHHGTKPQCTTMARSHTARKNMYPNPSRHIPEASLARSHAARKNIHQYGTKPHFAYVGHYIHTHLIGTETTCAYEATSLARNHMCVRAYARMYVRTCVCICACMCLCMCVCLPLSFFDSSRRCARHDEITKREAHDLRMGTKPEGALRQAARGSWPGHEARARCQSTRPGLTLGSSPRSKRDRATSTPDVTASSPGAKPEPPPTQAMAWA